MADIYKLFEDGIWKPEDLTSYIWCADNYEVSWNTDNNLEDLEESNGMTYSGEIYGEGEERDFYVILTLRDGCGGMFQAIFDLRNKQEF